MSNQDDQQVTMEPVFEMRCYEVQGIIDDFHGLIPARFYYRLFTRNFKIGADHCADDCRDYMEDKLKFKQWVSNALRKAYDYCPAWEGDVRDELIFVGASLWVELGMTMKYLIFKQDNNGSTFIVSDGYLDIPDLELMTKKVNREHDKFHVYLEPIINNICN